MGDSSISILQNVLIIDKPNTLLHNPIVYLVMAIRRI